ncbi:MAG: hypothetical protein J0L56_12435 [Chitinophagales bacterium]|nr:hypothetical protein [Chitinophagales bacterium]
MSATMGGNSDGRDFFNLFSSGNIFYTVGFWSSLLLYLPGMVIINLFINEANFKTHRQNIIDGWKRETFIFTKIGLIVCFSLAITLMNLIAVITLSNIIDVSPDYTLGLKVLCFIFLQAMVYLMFALALATFFRRSGIAIIVFFIYGIIFELLLAGIIWYFFPKSSMPYFLPLQVADALTPVKLFGNLYAYSPSEIALVLGAVFFIALYIYLAVRKYKYDDL